MITYSHNKLINLPNIYPTYYLVYQLTNDLAYQLPT
jgi:hypothetical protein